MPFLQPGDPGYVPAPLSPLDFYSLDNGIMGTVTADGDTVTADTPTMQSFVTDWFENPNVTTQSFFDHFYNYDNGRIWTQPAGSPPED